MLYIDQPTQVGLSYDTLANITFNTVTGKIVLLGDDSPPKTNATYLTGTYPSQNRTDTAQGSRNAAIALWHFAQTWFQEFPFYQPNDNRISMATESYGGRYGPAFFSFFEEQNQKIENGTWNTKGETAVLQLDTLLIINGCIDRQVQWPSYPQIAWNNTYGIKTVNDSVHQDMLDAYYGAGGCRDQIDTCRQLASQYDVNNTGINATVNSICKDAETYCSNDVRGPYLTYSGRNYYDFGQKDPDPFPPPFYEGYLNQPHVQAALGAPLNWTQSSNVVSAAFRGIGDYPRPGWLADLAYLLDNNIKVTLVYGDRDYACNWIGGEAVSLAIPYSNTPQFSNAGYAPIQTNDTYVGGQVRQHGNLSFSRVYESGHEVPAYQPETAYRIFMRALFNNDIATGQMDTLANRSYSTEGPESSWQFKNEAPPQFKQYCYVLDPTALCTKDQIRAMEDGSAEIVNYIVVDKNSTALFPAVAAAAKGSESGSGSGGGGPSASASGSNQGSPTGTCGGPHPSDTGTGGGEMGAGTGLGACTGEKGAASSIHGRAAWTALVVGIVAAVFLV